MRWASTASAEAGGKAVANGEGGGGGQIWFSNHKTTTHSYADCHIRPANRSNGNAHFALFRPQSVLGICSSCDFLVQDDSDEKL